MEGAQKANISDVNDLPLFRRMRAISACSFFRLKKETGLDFLNRMRLAEKPSLGGGLEICVRDTVNSRQTDEYSFSPVFATC